MNYWHDFNQRGRPYTFVTTFPGVTTAIYIDAFGSDMYVSWKSFHRRPLNWFLLLLIPLVGLLLAMFQIATSSPAPILWNPYYTPSLVMFTTLFSVGLVVLAIFFGRLQHGEFFYHFFTHPAAFDVEVITAMNLTVHRVIQEVIKQVNVNVQLRAKAQFKAKRDQSV